MKIGIVGKGIIGTIYGYLFKQSGNTVKHLIRENNQEATYQNWTINCLDGRYNKVKRIRDTYQMELAEKNEPLDLVFVSVPNNELEQVIATLDEHNIQAPLLLFCSIWNSREWIEAIIGEREYLLGYPAAGGTIEGNHLTCALFDHIQLEAKIKTSMPIYNQIRTLFHNTDLKIETPYDMLEWIWIHTAINAGFCVTAGANHDLSSMEKATTNLMTQSKLLSDMIQSIREALQIVKKRGVKLNSYWEEISLFYLPSFIAVPLLKRMFRKEKLTQEVLALHYNTESILELVKIVFESAQKLEVSIPTYQQQYKKFKQRTQEKKT